jgi:hypothetical protein
MIRRKALVLLAIAAAVVLPACKKKAAVQGVALQVGFSDKVLSDNLITDVQYKWKTDAAFAKLPQDYTVYVHYWHKNNLLFQDDFSPEPPTTQWAPGKEYAFTRRIYIPTFIDEFDPQFKGEETLRMVVGLYSPYDRTGKEKIQILERKLTVVPPPADTPQIVYESGWYGQENDPNSFLKQWRWTGPVARCLIDNPRRDALLVIRGGVNKEILPDQKIVLKINDIVLDEFIPEIGTFDKSYVVKKEMLGEKADFALVIAPDKTFVPGKVVASSQDQRELGLQVSFLYFR